MKRYALTEAQKLLQEHLRELGYLASFEFRFCMERKYRFDVYIADLRLGIECHGTFQGVHGTRWANSDLEKLNLAQMHGYRVLQFTNKQVLSGAAKEFLATWLQLPAENAPKRP